VEVGIHYRVSAIHLEILGDGDNRDTKQEQMLVEIILDKET
jgi:hypothetical protein